MSIANEMNPDKVSKIAKNLSDIYEILKQENESKALNQRLTNYLDEFKKK